MTAAIVLSSRDSEDEVRISLHPISLALLLAEVIEEAARKRCRHTGHGDTSSIHDHAHCDRCGASLPDAGRGCRAWHQDAYRAIRPKRRADR